MHGPQTLSAEKRQPAANFRIGAVLVEPNTGTVSGPGGVRHLDPKVMDVLVCLTRSAGEVVSRDTLMQEVWGDVIVTDFALSRCIYQLRKCLTEAAHSTEQPIETLPKRGYRLVWPTETTAERYPVAAESGSRTIALVGVLLVLLVLGISTWTERHLSPTVSEGGPPRSGDVRLVVFPLDDLSEDQTQKVFADGLARELLHHLAALPGIVVIGRTTSFESGKTDQPKLELTQRLEADYFLSGSVQPVGTGRRVLLELDSVADGAMLWSRSFMIGRSGSLAIFRNVAGDVARLFQFAVDPSLLPVMTENLEAFELFLAAGSTRGTNERRRLLMRAVELDPQFAQAWNFLAFLDVIAAWDGDTPLAEAWAHAQPLIERALEIEPDLLAAEITQGAFFHLLGQPEVAIHHMEKVLAVDPGNTLASGYLGMALRSMGRYEEALAVHRADVALDPLASLLRTRLGTSYWFMEDHEEADRQYQLAIELDPLNHETYDSRSAMLGLGTGRFDLALSTVREKMNIEGMPISRTYAQAGWWAGLLGLDDIALEYWRQAERTAHVHSKTPGAFPFSSDLAAFQLANGDDSGARATAEWALEADPCDPLAHLVMAIFDVESGHADRLLDRVQSAFPEMFVDSPVVAYKDVVGALFAALAYIANGHSESAAVLLQGVVDALPAPRSRDHLSLAAAQAMRGELRAAIAELNASPPGWVRARARLLLRDPLFQSLQDVPEFRGLVTGHIKALNDQATAYR